MLFNHAAFRVRNSWRSAAGRPPGEAGQLRFASRWKKVQGARHAPCGRALRPGRETVPGTRADRFHPGCQRPRGPRDLGARHPHSPPAASDRGSLTSTALARLPRFWCAQRQKRGENPCPSLSLDLVRVGGMRPQGPQTWGEPRAGTTSHVLAEEDAEWERSRKGRPRSHDASRGGVLLRASCA